MENEFTVERAMKAPTVEALIALAYENGVLLPAENAADLFADLHAELGALPDEALDAISGGIVAASVVCPECYATNISIAWHDGLTYACNNPACSRIWTPNRQH